MRLPRKPPPRKVVKPIHIVVDAKDPRQAKVIHDERVLFTIRTDVSGMHPSIIVVAQETQLKAMEKGKTGLVLWNAPPGRDTRNLKLH
jgi:hypothetical protein